MVRRGWRCADSPTGAHEWVNITGSKWWICIYCGEDTNRFLMEWNNRPSNYNTRQEHIEEQLVEESLSSGRVA